MLLPHMVCNALVAGGRLLGAEQQAMRPGCGKFSTLIQRCTDKHISNSLKYLAITEGPFCGKPRVDRSASK